jgi:GT2 family glycosyltransferase
MTEAVPGNSRSGIAPGVAPGITPGIAPGVALPAPPLLSIVIPVFDQPEMLLQCLASIRECSFTNYEILISDDGSRDSDLVRTAAGSHGAIVVRSGERRGSAAARNLAAHKSLGKYLVFLDADVTVHQDTLSRIAQSFESDDSLDALIGSYDQHPTATGATSQFRNLLHACVHQRSNPVARTFWTGCGAVKRNQFLAIGGFDESYQRPSVEDVEFGMRLHEAGGQIRLLPQIKVTHHKTWTLASMVHTDFFSRAIPWTALVRCHGLPTDLSFRMADRAAAVLAAGALFAGIVALLRRPAWWAIFAICLCGTGLLQGSTLRYFKRLRGVAFAIRCFPLLVVYDLVCVAGLVAGLIQAERRSDR